MDELTILNQPKAVVLRDGVESEIEASGIVKDDVIVLDAGKQICNDSVVIAGSLEVNESLLTGESASITKTAGAELFSGSSAISGRCYARVTHVGADNYATSLVKRGTSGEARPLRTARLDAQGHQVHRLPDHSTGHRAVPRSHAAAPCDDA
ncbi:hypothetical protein [Bifidobacterium breve]|uniref:P-type ATPase n=1 Tax=Bifidobacterium breve TaxID=1685 RepID=UPI0022B05F07|nr:hypothetical protein [Bifidobacterium breve]MCZ4443552.1 hypothetical protein [Bifidobacterium breve]MCZ4445340.1 hypothetical protein [Bifidobacterium breve]MCZ4452314.1 hypothetical protein [Bifidobacterium breve]MDU2060260.1 hypothetical protein [Bifidobacterium breve]MDU2070550.1 hypothetical protein [Bifidobacterium breve]